jgi:hypothetical protein
MKTHQRKEGLKTKITLAHHLQDLEDERQKYQTQANATTEMLKKVALYPQQREK